MLRSQKKSLKLWRLVTSVTVAPLLVVTAGLTVNSHKMLLAQTPAASPTFALPASLPPGTNIKLNGSSSLTAISQALKQRFEEKYPGTTVDLASTETGNALNDLIAGKVDLVAIGRPLTDAEKAQGIKEVPVSREKIAIFVGSENPYKNSITAEQFAKIVRGEITNWAQIGGPDVSIRFIDRPDSSDTRQALSQYPMLQAAPFKTGATATQVVEDDTTAVIKELGRDGISYGIASQVLDQPTVTVLPMHDTLPSDPRYPYSQPRGYAYREGANLGVIAFLGFATSGPGQEVVAEAKKQEATAVPTLEAPIAPDSIKAPLVASPGEATTIVPATPSPGSPDLSRLWWLLLPLLGFPLLLWLLRGRYSALPAAAIAETERGRMILTPRNCRDAYAYWEIPENQFTTARQQGGRDLKVRLYDVTDNRDIDQLTPQNVKEFDPVEGEQDLHLPIAVDNRDYVAELGYLTAENQWIQLARSHPVRVPACEPVRPGAGLKTAGAMVGGAAVTSAAAVAARSLATGSQVMEPSRIIMVPRTPQAGYVYWEIPAARKAELKQAGGQKLIVRVHDTTGIDLSKKNAHSVRQYDCDERSQDLHVPIPATNRDYFAEVGYVTQDNRWLSIAKSAPVHVADSLHGVVDKSSAINAAAGAAAAKLAADVGVAFNPDDGTAGMPPHLGDVNETIIGFAGDAVASVSNLAGKTAETATTLTGDATKAVGTAIAGGTAAIAGLAAVGKTLLHRQPVAEADTQMLSEDCRIILVPRNSKNAYAYWEVSESAKKALRDQGGRRLMLRIHDATNLDIDYEPPHSTQTYVCKETDQDKHVVIPASDRDYIAELGYFTDDNRWLRLNRSLHVRVPAEG